MKRCHYCFKDYNIDFSICPHCGYTEDTIVEARYLEKGVILINRYLIGAVVGAGGFGVTYVAWDKVLEQRVAIKEFLPGEFSTRMPGMTKVTIYGGEKTEQFESGKEKFMEESKRLAKVQKIPGIVQIYNSFQENDTAYIVMEYLEGETLEERLRRENRISEQEAVGIMLPILQTLEIVHKQGILHRDIAPNNIFLTREGEVKLLDFGAARNATGTHSKSLTVLYKEGYTAEEQYRSRGDQGTWTDIYACAATLYRMLTGVVPPGAMERIRKDTLKEPSKMGIKISTNVNIAIMNALNVAVQNRTRTAEEFIKELTNNRKNEKHFIKTYEKKIGEIPAKVKFAVGGSLLVVGCVFILLFTGIIDFGLLLPSSFGVPEGYARVPNVINKETDKAAEIFEKNSLKMQITDKQFSNEIPKGKILSQSVDAGKIIEEEGIVDVVVSGGEKTKENGYELKENEVFVPDFQYKTLVEAIHEFEEIDLYVSVHLEKNEQVEPGKIIGQSLEAGNVVENKEIVDIIVSSPDSIEQTYDYIQNENYQNLQNIHQQIVNYMEENQMEYAFYSPRDSVTNSENGKGLELIKDEMLTYYLGETSDGEMNGNGTYAIKCECGSSQEISSYNGEWKDGVPEGHGVVNSHWRDGSTYRIEGEFENFHGEGVMKMQWNSYGQTFHGQFTCIDSEIQPAQDVWYRQYFQIPSSAFIYCYSQERDADGIPMMCLTITPGSKVTIWGFEEECYH